MENFDVIVLGAGLNGLAAALALGGRKCRMPLRVAIIDRGDPHAAAAKTNDSRASAITFATQEMMRGLGVWDGVADQAQPIGGIVVTDAKSADSRAGLLSFLFPQGSPKSAMIENVILARAMLSEISMSPEIVLHAQTSVAAFQFGPGMAEVELSNGTKFKASLVVGAEGRNSPSRVAAGIKFEGWDYPQSAITLTVGHEIPHEGQAEEHFTPQGVFAILPLTGNRSSIVWTEPHERAKQICALPNEEFAAELASRFGSHRGALSVLSAKQAHPLAMYMSSAFYSSRLALIGDAAHVVHPLAGLGLNLGLKDAAALSDCVMAAVSLGQDIGSDAILDSYSQWRRFDTLTTAAMIDSLHRLFANDVEGLRLVRQAGLRIVNKLSPLKKVFANEAAGLTGTLPRLMRGLAA